MALIDLMRNRLEHNFHPQSLEIDDESEKHRGHAGYSDGGESHFHIRIRAASFGDMSRIARERAIHKALGPEIMGRIHALSLKIEA